MTTSLSWSYNYPARKRFFVLNLILNSFLNYVPLYFIILVRAPMPSVCDWLFGIVYYLVCFSQFCRCSHGIVIRGGAAGGEEGSAEEAGRHPLPDGGAHCLGSRGQRPLHSQPPLRRYSLWAAPVPSNTPKAYTKVCPRAHRWAALCFARAGQKISPDGKAKIQLQLVLHTGESTTFHFSNESSALRDREAAKELLQQLLPKFKKKANKELEEKNRWGSLTLEFSRKLH